MFTERFTGDLLPFDDDKSVSAPIYLLFKKHLSSTVTKYFIFIKSEVRHDHHSHPFKVTAVGDLLDHTAIIQ